MLLWEAPLQEQKKKGGREYQEYRGIHTCENVWKKTHPNCPHTPRMLDFHSTGKGAVRLPGTELAEERSIAVPPCCVAFWWIQHGTFLGGISKVRHTCRPVK